MMSNGSRATKAFSKLCLFAFGLLAIGPGRAAALPGECSNQKVEYIIQWSNQCNNGNLAFSTAAFPGKYICTANAVHAQLVLAAHLAGREIDFQFISNGNACDVGTSLDWSRRTNFVLIRK